MKKTSLGLAGLALLCATPALADNTDTATVTVSGTIIAPLTISNGSFTYPNLVKASAHPGGLTSGGNAPSGGTTSVSVTCGAADGNNTVTYTAGSNPFAAGTAGNTAGGAGATGANSGIATTAEKTGTCATLTVGGEAGYHYLVATPVVTSATNFTISGVNCRASAGPVTFGTGSLIVGTDTTLRCGATVAANSSVTAGTGQSAGSFTVTVTYD